MTSKPYHRTQIEQDLESWSEGRLHLWLKDSIDRFETADIPTTHAVACVASILLVTFARLFARATNATPEEAAQHLLEGIRYYRRLDTPNASATPKAKGPHT